MILPLSLSLSACMQGVAILMHLEEYFFGPVKVGWLMIAGDIFLASFYELLGDNLTPGLP